MRWLGWRAYLDLWRPGWRAWVTSNGIQAVEWIVQDGELLLDVQAELYEQVAQRLVAEGGHENMQVAAIYRGVAEGLKECAFDVYVSFK